MIRMVPGRYLVVAIPDSGLDHPTDPQLLEKLEPYAVPVTLTAPQPATIALKIARVQ